MSTEIKIATIDRLVQAGLPAIEVSSFVRPQRVPGLADAEKVFAGIDRSTGASMECCVGNLRGLERAIDARADAAWFLLSADAGFAAANIGLTQDQSIAELARMKSVADRSGINLGTYIIFAWGGPNGFARGPEDLLPLGRRLLDIGVDHWLLADSIGYAAPPQIRSLVNAAAELVPLDHLTVQLHDSRGMGVAGAVELAAIGLRNIDVALGGSGGHPAMRGSHGGGVCTEDLVQLFDLSGVRTGVDITQLNATANWLAESAEVPMKGFTRLMGAVPQVSSAPPVAPVQFAWPSSSTKHQ